MFYKKGVIRNFTTNSQENTCATVFFKQSCKLRPDTLLKKRLRHSYFPVNLAKFLRSPFLENTSGGSFGFKKLHAFLHSESNSKKTNN